MSHDDLWKALRQGARNVAGVTWQISVCVHLLVLSRSGVLPFVELIPEGFEDADCVDSGGKRTYVQMKELGGGLGRLAPSALADALAHAETSARGADILVLTDGSLGSDLVFTEWESVLADQHGEGIHLLENGLVSRGYTSDEASAILSRSRVEHFGYRVRQLSETTLAEYFSIHPSIAGVAVSRLTEVLAGGSSAQRHTTIHNAARIRTSELDAILTEAQETVDLEGLDFAISSGVCTPVGFSMREEISARSFYLGVDGAPGHVAANLDVVRPPELLACGEGLGDEGAVLLVGPSGSGKSVLLWRAARDVVPASRVLRVERLSDATDARVLVRHVRSIRPSRESPVLVVVDDLGRPQVSEWSYAASLLREVPSVLLIAACRAEDFSPSLLVGATRVVQPELDRTVADAVSHRLREQQIVMRMEPAEAFERSDGLLMEYVALLTSGQRLRQVLAAQVEALVESGREVQREAARLITAAHTLGLGLSADRLDGALGGSLNPYGSARVGDALGVLKEEHVVIQDGDTWRGLHELRSATICELVHENPPPRIGKTFAVIAGLIEPAHSAWMLRRIAENYPQALPEVVESLGGALATQGETAEGIAWLLEGAERADNTIYAREVLPTLREARFPGLPLKDVAMFAYGQRNQGLGFGGTGVKQLETAAKRIEKLADQLPLRSDYVHTLRAACAAIDQERLPDVFRRAGVLNVIRVLEAGYPHLTVSADLVRSVVTQEPPPSDVRGAIIWSRLIAASHPYLSLPELVDICGPVDERVRVVCAADKSVLTAFFDESAASVTITRLLPIDQDETVSSLLPWDTARPGKKDALGESTVACLNRIKDACPEIQRFRIKTVTAAGSPYKIQGFEPGFKDMQRSRFPDRTSVRQSVGFQAALRRLTSSETWTEVIIAQVECAAALEEVATELPLRFNPYDNDRRRIGWRGNLSTVRERLSGLRPPPLPRGMGSLESQAFDDQTDRVEDEATRVLRAAVEAIGNACRDDVGIKSPVAAAAALREAADNLDKARESTRTRFDGRGSVLPSALSERMRASAGLLLALHLRPETIKQVRASDPIASAREIWDKVRCDEQERFAETLRELLQPIPEVECRLVSDPEPAAWALDSRSWVVLVPARALDKVLGLLEEIDHAIRPGPGSRILVMCVSDPIDAAKPHGPEGFSSISGNPVLLGFGFQLSISVSSDALPVPLETVKRWSEVLDMRLASAVTSPLEVVKRLVERSHEIARLRMRRLPDLPAAGADSATSMIAGRCAPTVDTADSHLASPSGLAAISFLREQIAAEADGTASVCLAEVLLRPVTGDPVDAKAAQLLNALAELHLNSLALPIE